VAKISARAAPVKRTNETRAAGKKRSDVFIVMATVFQRLETTPSDKGNLSNMRAEVKPKFIGGIISVVAFWLSRPRQLSQPVIISGLIAIKRLRLGEKERLPIPQHMEHKRPVKFQPNLTISGGELTILGTYTIHLDS